MTESERGKQRQRETGPRARHGQTQPQHRTLLSLLLLLPPPPCAVYRPPPRLGPPQPGYALKQGRAA
eukprot:1659516-Rhodomonas_salina.1